MTTGRDSFGGIGFSSIDDSNNNGQYDAARIAVINESPASVITPTALAFYTNAGVSNSNAATEQVRINSSGSLGIGTNAPTHQLTVDETAGSSYALSARNFNDNLQIKLGTTTSGYANIQTTTISADAAYNMAGYQGFYDPLRVPADQTTSPHGSPAPAGQDALRFEWETDVNLPAS